VQTNKADLLHVSLLVSGVKIGAVHPGPLVSADELHMLMAPCVGLKTVHAQCGSFKYRNIFLLLCTLWFLIWFLLFPEAVYQVLTLPLNAETFSPYLQKRGWLYIFWLMIYGWSYARDWYFERVALVCFVSEMTILVMDYLTVFTHLEGAMSPLLIFSILLRCALVICLLMNSVYAFNAPSAPSKLWR
jgi:hypothetical protein